MDHSLPRKPLQLFGSVATEFDELGQRDSKASFDCPAFHRFQAGDCGLCGDNSGEFVRERRQMDAMRVFGRCREPSWLENVFSGNSMI